MQAGYYLEASYLMQHCQVNKSNNVMDKVIRDKQESL